MFTCRNMTVNVGSYKNATKNLLELTNEFNKISGYKNSMQKSVAFHQTTLWVTGLKSTIPHIIIYPSIQSKDKLPKLF